MPGSPTNPEGVYVLNWETSSDAVPSLPPDNWNAQYRSDLTPARVRPSSRAGGANYGPVRAGQYAMRFELRQSDRWPTPPRNNPAARAELAGVNRSTPQQPFEPVGAERWYGFSVYLPGPDENYLPGSNRNSEEWQDDQSPESVVQWHQASDNDSPPLALVTHAGKWKIAQRAWGDPNVTGYVWEDPEHYETGVWTDWVVHVKWSVAGSDDPDLNDPNALNDPTAFLHIWKNGTRVFTSQGKKNAYLNQGNYLKIGIYKWDWSLGKPSDTVRRVMYLDEVRITDGTGDYETVAPPLTCSDGFGNLADGRPLWVGNFDGDRKKEVLFYYPGDSNWRMGSFHGDQINWTSVGDTQGFGDIANLPFWIGNFSRADRDEVLFYYSGDGNWWLGSHDGLTLQWNYAGNTSGANPGDPNLGNINDRPSWIGDFNGDGRAGFLFYTPSDGNWWLGSHDGNRLQWSFAGNTAGANTDDPNFGKSLDGKRFWIGNFSRADRTEILFNSNSDGNWWLGSHDGNRLQWSFAGNTSGFGNSLDGKTFWVGDFDGDGRAELLFNYDGDGNWWLGTYNNLEFQWPFVGNTSDFGNSLDGKTFWVGDFNGDGHAELLFNYDGDGNWWLGTYSNGELEWPFVGNTSGLGNSLDGKRFWIGNFSRADRAEILFDYSGDGNWWLGSFNGTEIAWGLANSGRQPLTDMIVLRSDIPDLDGLVQVSLCRDGRVWFRGHVHNGGLQSVEFRVTVIVRAEHASIAMVYEGHAGGGQIGSDDPRDEDWVRTFEHPLIGPGFSQFQNASLEIQSDTRGDITGWLEDAGAFLARFVVGTVLMNNPVFGVIIVLVEGGTLIATGGFDSGARVIAGTLWLAGPQGTLVALIAEGVAALGSQESPISDEAYKWAVAEVFRREDGVEGGTLPPRERIIITDTIGADGNAFVFPRFNGKITLNMGAQEYANLTSDTPIFNETLVHELVHAWQLHNTHSDLAFIGDGLVAATCDTFGGDPYDITGINGTQPFSSLNLEQQAAVVQKWFSLRDSILPADQLKRNQLNKYIVENIRTGTV